MPPSKKDNLKSEVTFWQFTTLISLIIIVFSEYFHESQKFYIFYLAIFSILLFCLYKLILKANQLKKTGKKYENILLWVGISLIVVLIIGYCVYCFVSILFFPDPLLSKIAGWSVFTLIMIYLVIRKDYPNLDINPVSLKSAIASLFFIYIILWGVEYIYFHFENPILRLFSLVSMYKNIILVIVAILFMREVLIFFYNKHNNISNKSILSQIKNIKIRSLLKDTVSIMTLLFLVNVILIIPMLNTTSSHHETIKIDRCHIINVYELKDFHRILNIYTFSVPKEEDKNSEFMLKAILKKDGEYQEINLKKDGDKSNMQYYEAVFFDDFGLKILRFYDRNIYYLDSMTVSINKTIC